MTAQNDRLVAAGPSRLRNQVRTVLQAADVPSPDADATAIVAQVLGCRPAHLPLAGRPSAAQVEDAARLTARRAAREPLQHVLGHAGFRGLQLEIGPGVFVPRPETETLVESVLGQLRPGARIIELCAGSGAIAISLATENPQSEVLAVEVDPDALTWLRRNIGALREDIGGAGSSVTVLAADIRALTPGELATDWSGCDAVVANPPYIPVGSVPRDPEVSVFDPDVALYSGADGLDHVRAVARIAAGLLRVGGILAIEHGDTQGEPELDAADGLGVPGVLRGFAEFVDIVDVRDLAGRPRVTLARLG